MSIIRIVLSFSFGVLFLFSKVLQAKEDDDGAQATRPANRSKLVLTLEGVQLVERKVALFLLLAKRNLEAFEESAAGTVKEREREKSRKRRREQKAQEETTIWQHEKCRFQSAIGRHRPKYKRQRSKCKAQPNREMLKRI